MRYREIKIDGRKLSGEYEAACALSAAGLNWLVDSEVEDAVIEVLNGTVIWHGGDFLSGYWRYGIFKAGSFHGVWEGGIFEGGEFSGRWLDGIKLC